MKTPDRLQIDRIRPECNRIILFRPATPTSGGWSPKSLIKKKFLHHPFTLWRWWFDEIRTWSASRARELYQPKSRWIRIWSGSSLGFKFSIQIPISVPEYSKILQLIILKLKPWLYSPESPILYISIVVKMGISDWQKLPLRIVGLLWKFQRVPFNMSSTIPENFKAIQLFLMPTFVNWKWVLTQNFHF